MHAISDAVIVYILFEKTSIRMYVRKKSWIFRFIGNSLMISLNFRHS